MKGIAYLFCFGALTAGVVLAIYIGFTNFTNGNVGAGAGMACLVVLGAPLVGLAVAAGLAGIYES